MFLTKLLFFILALVQNSCVQVIIVKFEQSGNVFQELVLYCRQLFCSCPAGYRGDPFFQCSFDPVRAKRKTEDKEVPKDKVEDKVEEKEVELPAKEE